MRAWIIAAPPVLVIVLIILVPSAIDMALVAIYLGFAATLLWLAWQGPDALSLARFESVATTHTALVAGALVLVASAFVDLFVAVDILWMEGRHVAAIVAGANFISPLVLGLAALVAGRSRVVGEAGDAGQNLSVMDDKEVHNIAEQLDRLMREQQLFRDANLTRLSRRAGITARRVSISVNRVHAKNVSQYINGYRIAEALKRPACQSRRRRSKRWHSGRHSLPGA